MYRTVSGIISGKRGSFLTISLKGGVKHKLKITDRDFELGDECHVFINTENSLPRDIIKKGAISTEWHPSEPKERIELGDYEASLVGKHEEWEWESSQEQKNEEYGDWEWE